MARIDSRVLAALQKLYNYIPGQKAPGELEVDLPVAVQHDVSRDTMYASGVGPWQHGFFQAVTTHTHVAPGTISSSLNLHIPPFVFQGIPGGIFGDDPFDGSLLMAWLYGGYANNSDDGDFERCSMTLQNSGDSIGMSPIAVPTPADLLFFHSISAIDGVCIPEIPGPQHPVPFMRRPNGNDNLVAFVSVAINVGTVAVHMGYTVWLGSRWVLPPGM